MPKTIDERNDEREPEGFRGISHSPESLGPGESLIASDTISSVQGSDILLIQLPQSMTIRKSKPQLWKGKKQWDNFSDISRSEESFIQSDARNNKKRTSIK